MMIANFELSFLFQGQIKVAKRRVVMASLYLGTGPLEQELVRFEWGVASASRCTAPWHLAERGLSLALAHGQLLFSLPGHRGMSGGPMRRECRGLMLGLLALLASDLFTQHQGP